MIWLSSTLCLLSADRLDASALKTNLLHIHPELEGRNAGDYSFSFVPVKAAHVLRPIRALMAAPISTTFRSFRPSVNL